jgi:CHAT domain-containing protein/Tfp pilus assembly protein PilF
MLASSGRSTSARLLLALLLFALTIAAGEAGTQPSDPSARLRELNAAVAKAYQEKRYDEGARLAEQALKLARQAFGARHQDTLGSMSLLAAFYVLQGRYDAAEPLLSGALQVSRKMMGARHPKTLTSMSSLALMYSNQHRYGEAEPLLAEVVKLRREVLGARHPDTLSSMNNLAALYKRQERYSEAELLYREALLLRREVFGPRHSDTIDTMNNLVELYVRQRRYGEAEPVLAEVLQLRREVLGARHLDTLASINNLALLYQSQGRYGEAEPLYTEALQLRREVLGPRHPETLTSMNDLASLYESQGRYGEAEPLYSETLQIRREVLGPRHPDTLASMNNLGELYRNQGRYGKAELLHREALQLSEEVLGARHPATLFSMNNLASLYQSQGRYGEAEPLYREALRLRREVLGARHPDTLTSMNDLGLLFASQGRYGEAESLLSEALQLSREVLGARHPETLTSMDNMAGLYQRWGRYGEAEPLFAEALQLRREVLGPRHPDTLTSMNNLASLYESQGRYREAEPLYSETLQISREVLGPRHPKTLLFQMNGVASLAGLGRDEAAVRQLAAMEPHLLIWLGSELYSSESPGVRMHLVASQADYQDVAISLALRPDAIPEAAPTAASAVLRFKNLQAEEEAYLAQIVRHGDDPKAQELAREIATLRSRLATLFHARDNAKRLEQVARDLDAKELALGRQSRKYQQHLKVRNVSLRDLQQSLPDRTALLEFRHFQPIAFDLRKMGAPHWAGLLLTRDKIRVLDLGPVAETPEQIKAILGDVDGAAGRAAAQALHEQLFGKLGHELAGLGRLYLAPDGVLHLVPFDALLDAAGHRLAERLDVRRLETGRDLLRPDPDRPSKGLIALGGIDFGPRPVSRSASASAADAHRAADAIVLAQGTAEAVAQQRAAETLRGGFSPLAASQGEIEAIGQEYRVNRRDEPVELWNGREADEARLKALARPPRVLHLATHGFYRAAEGPLDRPMLLAGVALAGANRALRDAGEDGILYAIEAQGLNLEGTELVILSACETAQGQIDYGEGVSGLVRAFRTAGVRYVLVALRPVGDQGASSFMQRFYHHWLAQAGSDPAAALRAAQVEAITAPEPHDPTWAYFSLVGG